MPSSRETPRGWCRLHLQPCQPADPAEELRPGGRGPGEADLPTALPSSQPTASPELTQETPRSLPLLQLTTRFKASDLKSTHL